MNLFSISFFFFFPIIAISYYIVPTKFRKYLLFFASLFFYFSISFRYAVLLFVCICISYFMAHMIQKYQMVLGKVWLAGGIIFFSVLLLLFKYLCAVVVSEDSMHQRLFFLECSEDKIIFPMGMGFLVLQIIGYLCDVYRKKTTPSEGFINYALYICFFPKVLSGPLLDLRFFEQVNHLPEFDPVKTERGLCTMLYGYIEKLLVANCIVKFSDVIFNNYRIMPSIALITGAVGYAFFLYFDFAGYSHIAIGAAKVLGFDIPQNFNRPYLAVSIKEFWKRWHISLSEWLKNYVYIPLGGNQKGTFKKYRNLLLTFCASGIWHGVGFRYIFWGMLHGIYQIVEDYTEKTRWGRYLCSKCQNSALLYFFSVVKTFLLVDIAWIFFRSASLREGVQYCLYIFTHWGISLNTLHMEDFRTDRLQLFLCILVMIIIFGIQIAEEKGFVLLDFYVKQKRFIKWSVSMSCIFLILLVLFRTMGEAASNFVYAQF